MKISAYRIPAEAGVALRAHSESPNVPWVQFGDERLFLASDAKWSQVDGQARAAGMEPVTVAEIPRKQDLHLVVQIGRLFQREHPDVRVLFDRGRYLVVELDRKRAREIGKRPEPCYSVRPLPENVVLYDVRRPAAARAAPVAWVQELVDRVTRSSLEANLSHLVSFPTRFSTSSHYANAAAWALGQLQGLGYVARLEPVALGGGSTQNVIADRVGSGTGERGLVLVVAHLDSINHEDGPTGLAPGADDNGSGSGGLIEIARALRDHPNVNDLRLILFGGEEQGLFGSTQFVAQLAPADRTRLRAVINMDMIGTLNTPVPTVLLEGAPVSQTVIDGLAEAASVYTGLTVQTSLNPFASDHVPFIDAGLPAVLTIEGTDDANPNEHTANDTLDHVSSDLMLEILRMNTAVVATALDRQAEIVMPIAESPPRVAATLDADTLLNAVRRLSVGYSGRYACNGGINLREERAAIEQSGTRGAVITNPIYNLDEPIYLAEGVGAAPGALRCAPFDPVARTGNNPPSTVPVRFTLHIDVDGTDPLNVVSGHIAGAQLAPLETPPHFIGRVTGGSVTGNGRALVVEDLSFTWPGGTATIDRMDIQLSSPALGMHTADVTFVDTAHGLRFGPYLAEQQSTSFREVEVEVDIESSGVNIESYDTAAHPDRPVGEPAEILTLETAFAKAGIRITRSAAGGTVVDTMEAGADKQWTYRELHDSMTRHWDAYANVPQWKLWIFLAGLAKKSGLGGVMFDGDIDEPGGVDRQGTAIFTCCPHYHTEAGAYIQANLPAGPAIRRELFFNLIHETGHGFNLAHSADKQGGLGAGLGAWTPPPWLPLAANPRALSWMNYPEEATPGGGDNASWFYQNFRFRFEASELLFLRHAPDRFVRMGDSAWFQNHARVARSTLDRRLELILRSRKPAVEFGESLIVELRLKNVSSEPVMVHRNLDPSDGYVELAVTNPRGERLPHVSVAQTRVQVAREPLTPGKAIYQSVNLTMGKMGFPFKEPGPYRIEASYANVDGTTAAAVMQVYVRRPVDLERLRAAAELFDARVGRTLYVGGSRALGDVNEKLDWVRGALGEEHPASYYLTAARFVPLTTPSKFVPPASDRVAVLEGDPELAMRGLKPVVEKPEEAADAIGHIRYRGVVDAYTDAAVVSGERAAARAAQTQMLELFEKRAVVEPVKAEVAARVMELS